MKAEGAIGAVGGLSLTLNLAAGERHGARRLEERILELFDTLRVPIYRYLLCLNVCPQEAEEIIQETFLRLFKHLHSGGGDNNLQAWIFRVAHNMALNQMKSRKFLV